MGFLALACPPPFLVCVAVGFLEYSEGCFLDSERALPVHSGAARHSPIRTLPTYIPPIFASPRIQPTYLPSLRSTPLTPPRTSARAENLEVAILRGFSGIVGGNGGMVGVGRGGGGVV